MARRKTGTPDRINETHITAYALNELHGEEREKFESALAAVGDAEGRTISMSESARVAQELREDAGLSLTSPAVRIKPLIWVDDLTRWGRVGDQP